MRKFWDKRGTVDLFHLPDNSPETLMRLSDDDLFKYIAGWKPGTENWLAGQAELRRREGAPARLAIWISAVSLLISLLAFLSPILGWSKG